MNIKPIIYESLTPKQRIIASLEALARGDDIEKERLVKTCPKKSYSQNDAEFADKIHHIFDMALCVECDLRGCVIDYLVSNCEAEAVLSNMAGIIKAWENYLEKQGINPEIFEKIDLGYRHYSIKYFENFMPEPSLEVVEKFEKHFEIKSQ